MSSSTSCEFVFILTRTRWRLKFGLQIWQTLNFLIRIQFELDCRRARSCMIAWTWIFFVRIRCWMQIDLKLDPVSDSYAKKTITYELISQRSNPHIYTCIILWIVITSLGLVILYSDVGLRNFLENKISSRQNVTLKRLKIMYITIRLFWNSCGPIL